MRYGVIKVPLGGIYWPFGERSVLKVIFITAIYIDINIMCGEAFVLTVAVCQNEQLATTPNYCHLLLSHLS